MPRTCLQVVTTACSRSSARHLVLLHLSAWSISWDTCHGISTCLRLCNSGLAMNRKSNWSQIFLLGRNIGCGRQTRYIWAYIIQLRAFTEGASGPHFPSVADFTMLAAEAWGNGVLTTCHTGVRQREATTISSKRGAVEVLEGHLLLRRFWSFISITNAYGRL